MKRRNFKDLNGPNLLLMIHEGQNGRNIMLCISTIGKWIRMTSKSLIVRVSRTVLKKWKFFRRLCSSTSSNSWSFSALKVSKSLFKLQSFLFKSLENFQTQGHSFLRPFLVSFYKRLCQDYIWSICLYDYRMKYVIYLTLLNVMCYYILAWVAKNVLRA